MSIAIRPILKLPPHEAFDGSSRPSALLVSVKITEELCAHGVAELVRDEFVIPEKPPQIPHGASYFQYTMLYSNAAGVPFTDPRGNPLPLRHPTVMAEFDLVVDANDQVIPNPAGAGGAVPAGAHYFGATQSDRSGAYRDYSTERSLAVKIWDNHVARTQCAVAVIDGCCTETGRLVYREFTADSNGNPARIPAIIGAINSVIETGLGIGSAATLEVYRAIVMTYNMNIADLLAVMEKLELVMTGQGDPVSQSVRLEVFKKAIQGWEDVVKRPYTREFDQQDREPIEMAARIRFLLVLEAKLTRETGHGSGSLRPRPRPHPIQHTPQDRRQSTPRAARVGPFTSIPGESPSQALASSMAAAAFLCSGCQSPDHAIRNCPLYTWCSKCNWCHERRSGCDNGLARSLWESARTARRGGAPAGRGGGQPRPMSGGGAGYAHAPIAGGGRRSPSSGRGAPRR